MHAGQISLVVLSTVVLATAGPSTAADSVLYSLPQYATNRSAREEQIREKDATLLYGPGVGGGPWSPAGPLGQNITANDFNITAAALDAQSLLVAADTNLTDVHSASFQNMTTLDDYVLLYSDDNWAASSAPTGIAPGVLQNYTSDLLFSMQRLSFSPYLLRRLDPEADQIPFPVADSNVTELAGVSLDILFKEGRIFYSDNRRLQHYELNGQPMYCAYSDALFYISPASGDFLPLAIRTNANNQSLIYTPLDSADDWLLAKIMFNADDFMMEAFHHLANTHYVSEIIYEAAMKTMSDDHPIMPLLARAMYGAFGVRPLAVATLFSSGGVVESLTAFTGTAMENLTNDLYFTGGAGEYTSNYFHENLIRRGLLKPRVGPELRDFPFFEDASVIHAAQKRFMHAFVYSYYWTDEALAHDNELQAWLAEANGAAQAIRFPNGASLRTRADLVDLLTHFVHLTTTSHHTVNLNQLMTAGVVLPLNPTALFQPVPTAKGVRDVASYLPPYEACIGILQIAGDFARPLLAHTWRSALHLFDDQSALPRLNQASRDANQAYMREMLDRSAVVAGRKFDARGLSQGMPFIWQALDPQVMLFSTTI